MTVRAQQKHTMNTTNHTTTTTTINDIPSNITIKQKRSGPKKSQEPETTPFVMKQRHAKITKENPERHYEYRTPSAGTLIARQNIHRTSSSTVETTYRTEWWR